MTLTNKKTIGITGGIASGKSSFVNILIIKGYTVIDADKISRALLEVGLPTYYEIISEFGVEILNENQAINKGCLSQMIFGEKVYRDKLEAILHPHVFREIERLIDKHSKSEKLIFVDIPLLYEKYDKLQEYNIYFDEIYLVYVDRDTQIKRLVNRDNISVKEAIRKIDIQMPMEEKKKLANKIIYNTKDLKNLELEADRILKDLY